MILFKAVSLNTDFSIIADPSSDRLHQNIELYQRYYQESKADIRMQSKFGKKTNKAKKNKTKAKRFKKFYYTKNEDNYRRYLLEKVYAKNLCRGETVPPVSSEIFVRF